MLSARWTAWFPWCLWLAAVALTALALSVDVAASVSDKLVSLAFPTGGALVAARRTERAGMNTRSAAWMVGLRQAQEGF